MKILIIIDPLSIAPATSQRASSILENILIEVIKKSFIIHAHKELLMN